MQQYEAAPEYGQSGASATEASTSQEHSTNSTSILKIATTQEDSKTNILSTDATTSQKLDDTSQLEAMALQADRSEPVEGNVCKNSKRRQTTVSCSSWPRFVAGHFEKHV